MRKKFFLLFLLVLLFSLSNTIVGENEHISLTVPKNITPYTNQEFSVSLPSSGTLEVFIDDGINSQFTILKQEVDKGPFTFHYNGLIEGGIPLKKATYTIHANLYVDDRFIYTTKDIVVKDPKQQLLFALPSSNQVYQNASDWTMDFALSIKDTLTIDVLSSDGSTPLHSLTIKNAKMGSHQLSLQDLLKNSSISSGHYEIRAYLKSSPEESISFPLEILPNTQENTYNLSSLSLLSLLPSDLKTNTLRSFFNQPQVVINTSNKREKIFELPTKESDTVGTLYPLTQGVEVLSLTTSDDMAYIGFWRIEDGQYVKGYVPQKYLLTRQSHSNYGVIINKENQSLSVYQQGLLLDTLPISTGLITQKNLNYETPAGSFFIKEKNLQEQNNKRYEDYLLTLGEGFSIHQLPYKLTKKKADFSDTLPSLGNKTSTGNIYVDFFQKEGTDMNAFWLWSHIPVGTKVVIIDDLSQRTEQIKTLFPDTFEELLYKPIVTQSTTPLSEEELSRYARVLLSFAGDCVLGGEEHSRKDPRSFDNIIAEKGYAWPFSGLVELFSKDDMTVVNLEGVLQDHKEGMQTGKMHIFRGDPSYTEILRLGEVDQVNIANNHYIDYGEIGKKSTQEALNKANIPYSGFEQLCVFTHNGYKIGFSGIRETIYKQNPSIMENDIQRLQEVGCDVIVYACHFGKEYSPTHNQLQTKMARHAVDLGANIVIGHHAHVVQGIEAYGNGVIFYGLGNFVFGGNLDLTEFDALVVQTELLFEDNDYKGVQVKLVPVHTSGAVPANDFRPVIATGEGKENILNKIQADTLFPINETLYFPVQTP